MMKALKDLFVDAGPAGQAKLVGVVIAIFLLGVATGAV